MKVLADPDARRQPRVAERRARDELTGMDKGRRTYQIETPRRSRTDRDGNPLDIVDGARQIFFCDKCPHKYEPIDLEARRLAAIDRGEDLYLERGDTHPSQR